MDNFSVKNSRKEAASLDALAADAQINYGTQRKKSCVPLWERSLLTLPEAAEYTGLGMQKLRDISNDDDCGFVLWVGAKRMFKRKKLENYLESQFSV